MYNTELIINSIGYQFYDTIPIENHVGCIWLMWKWMLFQKRAGCLTIFSIRLIPRNISFLLCMLPLKNVERICFGNILLNDFLTSSKGTDANI